MYKKKNLIIRLRRIHRRWIFFVIIGSLALIILIGLFGLPLLSNYLESRELLANSDLRDYYLVIQDRRERIKADSEDWDAYLSVGFNWKSMGDMTGESKYYRKAVEAYERAIAHFGMQGYVVYLNAGNLYRQLGEYIKAEDRYKKAIEIGPGEPNLYLALTDLYRNEMQKSEEEIIAVYKYALSRLVNSGPLIQDYAAYLREIGRTRDALMYYNLLVNSRPDNEDYKLIADELRAELAEQR